MKKLMHSLPADRQLVAFSLDRCACRRSFLPAADLLARSHRHRRLFQTASAWLDGRPSWNSYGRIGDPALEGVARRITVTAAASLAPLTFADAPDGVDLATVGLSRTTRRLLASVAYLPGDMAI